MRFKFRRRRIEVPRSGPYQLPTALEAIRFDAAITGSFTPGSARHSEVTSVVLVDACNRAASISQAFGADDVLAAGAAINADLGRPRDCPNDHYKQLTVTVGLTVTAEAARAAAEHRRDEARIARMKHLRSVISSDPSLLAIEYLDRNPGAPPDLAKIVEYYKMAGYLQEAGEWWGSLLAAWNELVAISGKTPQERARVMKRLRDAIYEMDAGLAAKHCLPKPPDG
ncbi:hypothetical protein [Kribbella deserti]|uniref:Uncharacterized protein n=1 Tax=Kribbella deserti TaxID=1926257 RepID=A0ABV6QF49_9ACTN